MLGPGGSQAVLARTVGRVFCLCVLLVAVVPAVASATTWQVTNTLDPGSVKCTPGDCSLRGAIASADEGAGGDTVLVPAGTYKLNNGLLALTKGVQIVGAGASTTVIDAQTLSGIFSVPAATGPISISGLTLENGKATNGSAITATGAQQLTLNKDVFSHDTSGGNSGNGAVTMRGTGPATLTVSEGSFNANAAGGNGTATVSSGQGGGGAIDFFASTGAVSISASSFTSNTAGGDGGAGTSSGQGGGGAVEVDTDGSLAIASSSFTANEAGGNGGTGGASGSGEGGAVSFFGESATSLLSISASTFSGNDAGGSEGPEGSGEGAGGAIEVDGEGSVSLADATLQGNNANHGAGGGITTELATSLVNDTFSGNASTGGIGGNIQVGTEGSVNLKNTIVAEGAAPMGADCAGPAAKFISGGHNIEDTTPSQCGLGASGDQVGVKPLLGPLKGNGGPVATEALLTGSPAIDAGDNSGCPATDARGVLRPAGAACDIGAFEIATPAATTGKASTVSSAGATLNAIVSNPDIALGSASFQYGTTTAYGQSTAAASVAADSTQLAESARIGGLAPNTTYHFRVIVTNSVGTVLGADETFKTPEALPVLTALKLSSSRLRAQLGKGSSVSAAKGKGRGTNVSYSDSVAATTTFTVQRQVRGFTVGHGCFAHKPSKHHGKLHRCTKLVLVGHFSHHDVAGANTFHFTGRVNGKPLRAGRYRLRAVARSPEGQIGKAVAVGLSVVR